MARASVPPRIPRTSRVVDAAGVVILVTSVVWSGLSALAGDGDALPVIGLQLGCAASYLVARVLTRWQRPVVPVAVVAGVASALVLGSVVPNVSPLALPLGYANANAALYVLVAVAAVMAAAAFPPGPATAVAVPLAAAFALAALVSGSVTGAVVLILAMVLLIARALGSWTSLVLSCIIAVQLVVGVTALLGVSRIEGTDPALAERLLDDRRVLLWRDAAVLARRHPLSGTGPGGFQRASPVARSDADARWAHSGFLQQAAEQGAVGLALLLAAFGWGFARIWSAGTETGEDTFVVLGAVALAAVGLHAGVDYVLHFAAVPLVGAALVGAATAGAAVPSALPRAASVPAEGSRC